MVNRSEIEWWGDVFSVSCSFGGAGCHPGDTVELLVARAEESLEASIAQGGNIVIVRERHPKDLEV
jgi:hypothetical protein